VNNETYWGGWGLVHWDFSDPQNFPNGFSGGSLCAAMSFFSYVFPNFSDPCLFFRSFSLFA
jgi:hypothetical protein